MAGKKILLVGLALGLITILCSPAAAAINRDGPTADPDLYTEWNGMPAVRVQDGPPVIGFGYLPAPVNEKTAVDVTLPSNQAMEFTCTFTAAAKNKLGLQITYPGTNYEHYSTFSEFNQDFAYIRLNLAGETGQTVTVTDFTIDGQPFGFPPNIDTDTYYYFYNDDNSPFTGFEMTGTINFSALDHAGPPRLEIAVGLSPLPTPPSALLLLLGEGN